MIFELAEALLVSESTLFRKIKELNKLLAEFELQIKNNKLVGEESQIRYFTTCCLIRFILHFAQTCFKSRSFKLILSCNLKKP